MQGAVGTGNVGRQPPRSRQRQVLSWTRIETYTNARAPGGQGTTDEAIRRSQAFREKQQHAIFRLRERRIEAMTKSAIYRVISTYALLRGVFRRRPIITGYGAVVIRRNDCTIRGVRVVNVQSSGVRVR
jgi:hypothetical protein